MTQEISAPFIGIKWPQTRVSQDSGPDRFRAHLPIHTAGNAKTAEIRAMPGSAKLVFEVPVWRPDGQVRVCDAPLSECIVTRPKGQSLAETIFDDLVDAIADCRSLEAAWSAPQLGLVQPQKLPIDVYAHIQDCAVLTEATRVEVTNYWWRDVNAALQDQPAAPSFPSANTVVYTTNWIWLLYQLEPNAFRVDVDFYGGQDCKGEWDRTAPSPFVRLKNAPVPIVRRLRQLLWAGVPCANTVKVLCSVVPNTQHNYPQSIITQVEFPSLWP